MVKDYFTLKKWEIVTFCWENSVTEPLFKHKNWYTRYIPFQYLAYHNEPKKEKKQEKPQVFVNQYYVGQMVWIKYWYAIASVTIDWVLNWNYLLRIEWEDTNFPAKEDDIFKTKWQLKNHLRKQENDTHKNNVQVEDKRHEEEILKINQM